MSRVQAFRELLLEAGEEGQGFYNTIVRHFWYLDKRSDEKSDKRGSTNRDSNA